MNRWLEPALNITSARRRHLTAGSSFYSCLCHCLLKIDPDLGVRVYRSLSHSHLQLVPSSSLFQAKATQIVESEWEKLYESAVNDAELLSFAANAWDGSPRDWLCRRIEKDLNSTHLFTKVRAVGILGFANHEHAQDLLIGLREESDHSWIRTVAIQAYDNYCRNEFAQHWYKKFLTARDSDEALGAYILFKRCLDSRFFMWRHRVEESIGKDIPLPRWDFLIAQKSDLDNKAQSRERDSRQKFLGFRVQHRAWPWFRCE